MSNLSFLLFENLRKGVLRARRFFVGFGSAALCTSELDPRTDAPIAEVRSILLVRSGDWMWSDSLADFEL